MPVISTINRSANLLTKSGPQTPIPIVLIFGEKMPTRARISFIGLDSGSVNLKHIFSKRRRPRPVIVRCPSPVVSAEIRDQENRTKLMEAASRGHHNVIALLLERTSAILHIDWKDKENRTALSRAAQNGHEEVVRLLIARDDVDLNSQDDQGHTPLSWAAISGQTTVLKLLLARRDILVNWRSNNGMSPLSFAARRGDEENVKALLANQFIIVNSLDKQNYTPLLWAVEVENLAVVKQLLAYPGIDVTWRNTLGITPFMSAAIGGYEAILTELLAPQWNIPVAAKDRYGYTAFFFAAERGHVHVMRKLLSLIPMHETTLLDSRDIFGRTPLSRAAASGQDAAVNFLLEQSGVTC